MNSTLWHMDEWLKKMKYPLGLNYHNKCYVIWLHNTSSNREQQHKLKTWYTYTVLEGKRPSPYNDIKTLKYWTLLYISWILYSFIKHRELLIISYIAAQLYWKKWQNEISKITKSLFFLKIVYLTKVVS